MEGTRKGGGIGAFTEGKAWEVSLILVQRRWKLLSYRFTRYVAELAKKQKSGAWAEDFISDVTLPYFEQMLFLRDTIAYRQTSGNMAVSLVDEGRGTPQQDCAEDLLERIADLYEAPDPRGCVDTVLVEDVQCADSPASTSSAANGSSSESAPASSEKLRENVGCIEKSSFFDASDVSALQDPSVVFRKQSSPSA
ncbi:hypothetical protein HPB47_013780 [Ixodes persulcatus]|uniref:Uncharacterized protein n=1 Tax=Ixodes persulcatus TaxID=34615 RepID=A0AC60R1M4_IXOPE|nr:hypothetical protein HPB47_013780 [Ixodes persulcatus]